MASSARRAQVRVTWELGNISTGPDAVGHAWRNDEAWSLMSGGPWGHPHCPTSAWEADGQKDLVPIKGKGSED